MRKLLLGFVCLLSLVKVTHATNCATCAPSICAAVTSLSSAQLRTLDSVPVQLLPAPGATRVYLLHTSFFSFHYIAPVYDLRDMGVLYSLNNIDAINDFNATGSASDYTYVAPASDTNDPSSSFLNSPLVAKAVAPGLGVAGNGTLKITLFYSIIDSTTNLPVACE